MSDLQDVPLASLDLLRQLTDRHVIDQLLGAPAMTRAEIASRTGISKPTISESVRRLERAGVLVEAGQQVSGRPGRAGVYYALRDDVGVALAVSAGPEGLVAETLGVRGELLSRLEAATPSPVTAAQLDPVLLGLVRDAVGGAPAPVRATALSVAGPVDRDSGRLIRLPNAPFLVDELDPRFLLAEVSTGVLIIDNDVNWAAQAEHHDGAASDLDDFCYLYLGRGLGGAIVRDGQPVRGRSGLAGEPAHVITRGPHGRAMRLVECFGVLDLLQPGSAAIDVLEVQRALEGGSAAARRTRDAIVDAVAGVIDAMVTLLNPAGIVVGGPWSTTADFTDRLGEAVAATAVVPTPVRLARLDATAPLAGARLAAVRGIQDSLLGPLAKEMGG
jgi:predicted NBD/HSP70 family sugar kinase